MFTTSLTIKTHAHLSGEELATVLRNIAEELEGSMETNKIESTFPDAVVPILGAEVAAWTLDV